MKASRRHWIAIAEALGILTLLEVTDAVIEQARNIRAAHGFRVPDALHLATALVDGADVFVTGDKDLRRFEGVQVRVIHDR